MIVLRDEMTTREEIEFSGTALVTCCVTHDGSKSNDHPPLKVVMRAPHAMQALVPLVRPFIRLHAAPSVAQWHGKFNATCLLRRQFESRCAYYRDDYISVETLLISSPTAHCLRRALFDSQHYQHEAEQRSKEYWPCQRKTPSWK